MKNMLLKFMEKTGKKEEFELFLDIFHHIPKDKFAVIKISGETLENHMDVIAEDIAYLNMLEIFPVIVHGAGSTLDKKLPNTKKIDGIRVTGKEDMELIKSVFNNISKDLVDKIKEKGGSVEIAENVFECKKLEKYGYVGDVINVNTTKIKDLIMSDVTPIISPIGHDICSNDSNLDKLNINADVAAKELVKVINPNKLIIITEKGGILNDKNELIPYLNISDENDFDHITGGMLLKVKEIKDFLKSAQNCSVVITSAENLLREIFTIKGSGTFIKYHSIESTSDPDNLSKEKIKSLLEDSFGKKLCDDYFQNGIIDIIYEKNYEGIGILKKVNNIPYLDKFAVAKFRQGTGLGKSIWDHIIKKYPKLVWRSHPDNPFNLIYNKYSDGVVKKTGWFIYWNNLEDSEIISVINEVANIKKTLI
ncbi:MAG: hypothetical protein ABII01_07495 [Candidatus Woesearchaeota archaeon]